MPSYGHELRFGIFLTPTADDALNLLELSKLADALGLEYVTVQDHPYQQRFLDTQTLLTTIAAQTVSTHVAANVANLPLRPPFVLAKSIASLDVLSGGRAELGLGAGGFWDAIEAAGGPRRTPGEGVDALSEAIDIIRAAWDPATRSIQHEGTHYTVKGAKPGPQPVHPAEIWLGAYKPRMLRLTGRKADGWLPSDAYFEWQDFADMNARIDEAAVKAGRRPEDIRRLLNILEDVTPERMAEIAVEYGTSVFLLPVSTAEDVQRLAEETAPAVRELVEAADAPQTAITEPSTRVEATPTGLNATPTPPPEKPLSSEQVWDESARPTAGLFEDDDPDRTYTPDEQAAGQHLIDVHDHLRAELDQLREVVDQVGQGQSDANAVRSHLTRMTIRQNNWTLGTFCETYCRTVTNHHTLEDRSVFPHLKGSDSALGPVIARLTEEHEVISDLLERVDAELATLVSADSTGVKPVHEAIDVLTDALLSHFSYEERELVGPLARHGFY